MKKLIVSSLMLGASLLVTSCTMAVERHYVVPEETYVVTVPQITYTHVKPRVSYRWKYIRHRHHRRGKLHTHKRRVLRRVIIRHSH